MPKFLPTLGTTGWTNDTASVADYLLSCYLTTNSSDSVLHYRQNTSMQYTLKTKAGDILGIEEEMTNTLLNKFQAVFGQTAEVTVDLTVDDPNKPDQYSINFIGTVFDSEGKAVTVGKLVYIEDGRVVRIANINNG